MAAVKIKCPKTGKSIGTGFDMDRSSFESSAITNCSVKCPECGEMHVWNKPEAWLDD